jgi:hypothetical protein
MIYKIKLKNTEESVLIDDVAFEWLSTDTYLSQLNFLGNLRKHSSGCVVFQKIWKQAKGGFKTETIYLHKLLAEKYVERPEKGESLLAGHRNGDKLDCRIENLVFRTRSVASRMRKTSSGTGYTGVHKENSRYRAVITINGKQTHLGMFDTAEDAALAFNKVSRELYGDDAKINKIKQR